jgi:cyanophycin synthetase
VANSITRQLIKAEAERRGWKVEGGFFCQVTDNTGRLELFYGSRPLRSSANGVKLCYNKNLTLQYVESRGYKVPPYMVVDQLSSPSKEFLAKHKLIVAKPIDGERSIGVTVNIESEEALTSAIDHAVKNSSRGQVVLQGQLAGKLYRLFVLNGKLVAAAHRKAPEVIGDGEHSIRQLIELLNDDPRRGDDSTTPLKKIKLTDAEAFLGETLASIPAPGQAVRVSALDSISAGGEAVNVTDQVHPDWHKAVADITVPVALFVCGFDVMCEDISQPLNDQYLPLLEMNSSPGLKLHQYPTGGGEPVNLAKILLDETFDIAKV